MCPAQPRPLSPTSGPTRPHLLALSSGRAYYLVRPKRGGDRPQVEAFSRWLKDEFAARDWTILDPTLPRGNRQDEEGRSAVR